MRRPQAKGRLGHQQLEEAGRIPEPLGRGAWPCLHLDLGLLACGTVRGRVSVAFSHPACGRLFTAVPGNQHTYYVPALAGHSAVNQTKSWSSSY